jgi:hypothetical protein
MLERLVLQPLEPKEMAHENRVPIPQLAAVMLAPEAMAIARPEPETLEKQELVQPEPHLSQDSCLIGQKRLLFVDGQRRDLRNHRDGARQPRLSMFENRAFPALHIDLQQIELGQIGDIVQPDGLDLQPFHHLGAVLELPQRRHRRPARLQKRGKAAVGANPERPARSIAHHIGQVMLARARIPTQLFQRLFLRLEAPDLAAAHLEQALIGRHVSADAAFQRDRHQLLRFHGEFHRQGLQDLACEAVDDQRHRLFLVHPARRQ